MKGIVITKMVVVAAVILVAVIYLANQQGQLPSISGGTTPRTTTIKSTSQASSEITQIGSNVENIESILADIDKALG
ncbi:MAG: hypothetical protein HY361_05090 [Candidatus Aenigmarchaeota archaeon]|nr:hypothetical protein [Candidatus Aenigmarchaeota archaeon]